MFDATRNLGAHLGSTIGDASSWSHGVAQPTATVDTLAQGAPGQNVMPSSNATAAVQSVKVMHTMAAIVLASLAILWITGTVVFKGSRLP